MIKEIICYSASWDNKLSQYKEDNQKILKEFPEITYKYYDADVDVEEFKNKAIQVPTLVFLDETGTIVLKQVGLIPKELLLDTINYFNAEKSSAEDPIKEDKVNHPSHYTWLKQLCGIEVIDIARHMDFDSGNAIKYILRAGRKSEVGLKDQEKMIEDLEKAKWYITDKIKTLKHVYSN